MGYHWFELGISVRYLHGAIDGVKAGDMGKGSEWWKRARRPSCYVHDNPIQSRPISSNKTGPVCPLFWGYKSGPLVMTDLQVLESTMDRAVVITR